MLLGYILFSPLFSQSEAESRFLELDQRLDSLAINITGLEENTLLQLRDVPLHEYVRALGLEHNINVFINDDPSLRMTMNLANSSVKDVFLFICKTYGLTIEVTGSILRFIPFEEIPEEPLPKPLEINFEDELLSYDLRNDSLRRVVREISRLSGQRIVLKPGVDGLVSGFLPPTSLEEGLRLLFIGNGFRLSSSRRGYYVVSPVANPEAVSQEQEITSPQRRNRNPRDPNPSRISRRGGTDFMVEMFEDEIGEFLGIEAENADLEELIKAVFQETQVDYFIFEKLEGSVTIQLDSGSLENVLKHVFQGTSYTYKKEDGLILVGSKELEGVRATRIVKLKYRPTVQAIELIPPKSLEGVEVIEYAELNRIILRGPTDRVEDLSYFLEEVDKPIPMVKVEMIVVEVDKSRLLATGLKAGLRVPGDSLATTKQVLPGIDYKLTGPQVNDILGNSGIPFLSSLGRLSSNFYVQLRAQESQGNLSIKMKPVLSMLNGREATLTIGQTQYYLLDTQTSSTGAVNNFNQFTQRFEKIEANINLTVKPYISEADMVPLDLIPDFTNPLGTFDPNVPPTISTRKFESTIRVRNGETVILGGLSREETNESGSGIPFLSRIPVLKWFFSSREKSKVDSSLIIYITPVIYYN